MLPVDFDSSGLEEEEEESGVLKCSALLSVLSPPPFKILVFMAQDGKRTCTVALPTTPSLALACCTTRQW